MTQGSLLRQEIYRRAGRTGRGSPESGNALHLGAAAPTMRTALQKSTWWGSTLPPPIQWQEEAGSSSVLASV